MIELREGEDQKKELRGVRESQHAIDEIDSFVEFLKSHDPLNFQSPKLEFIDLKDKVMNSLVERSSSNSRTS